ncbi:hypothetical protein CPC08DRAFT_402190 [Agrocybe pediades]|nr:hypothetical protein CPC08DRAFT_402190 [Agrocybe pediades]
MRSKAMSPIPFLVSLLPCNEFGSGSGASSASQRRTSTIRFSHVQAISLLIPMAWRSSGDYACKFSSRLPFHRCYWLCDILWTFEGPGSVLFLERIALDLGLALDVREKISGMCLRAWWSLLVYVQRKL